jgi:plastocyanin
VKRPSTRATVLAALACALPLGVLPATADSSATPSGTEKQKTTGTIALPTRFPDTANGNADRGWPGLARRVWAGASQSNGVIARIIDVDPATWGGKFVVDGVTDATGAADLDVYFYSEMGDLGAGTPGVVTAQYATVAKGGETGFVAPGSRRAIVFTSNGVNSSFTYTAFTTPRLTIGRDALDATVPLGTTLTWVNGTGDYTFVRHLPVGKQKKAFDSGSGPASGLRNGEAFSHTFTATGTYVYETSLGQATITVVDGPGVGTPAA